MSCDDAHCVTCSDEGIAMCIVELRDGSLARCVGEDGTEAEVMTELVGAVGAGDVVLVHAGVALSVLGAR